MPGPAALLDQVTEELYARHTGDVDAAATARREYEERRGKVHQDDELWEAWSAAFVEWFVVERVAPGHRVPLAALTCRELGPEDPRSSPMRALVTSQRSLFEVRAMGKGGRNDRTPGIILYAIERKPGPARRSMDRKRASGLPASPLPISYHLSPFGSPL